MLYLVQGSKYSKKMLDLAEEKFRVYRIKFVLQLNCFVYIKHKH